VIVTAADHVPAGVGQPPHDVQVAFRRRPVHGVRVVAGLARVHIQPTLEEQIDDGQVPAARREVQERPPVRLRARVQLVRSLVEQPRRRPRVTTARGFEQPVRHRPIVTGKSRFVAWAAWPR
jgi:hypothetical protein